MNIVGAEAGCAALDQEATHALVGFSPDHSQVGDTAVGDPHLGPVQNIRVAVALRPGLHAARIAAGVRFSQAKAADNLATGHLWQPALLLLLRAKFPDWEHRQRALDRDKRAQAAIAGLQLLAGQPIADRAQTSAAVALQVHPQQAQRSQFRNQLARECAGLEMLADNWQHTLLHKLAHSIAHHPFFCAQKTVKIIKVGRRRCCRTGSKCIRHRESAFRSKPRSMVSSMIISPASSSRLPSGPVFSIVPPAC